MFKCRGFAVGDACTIDGGDNNARSYSKYYKLATDIEVNNTLIKSLGKVPRVEFSASGNIILSPSQGI